MRTASLLVAVLLLASVIGGLALFSVTARADSSHATVQNSVTAGNANTPSTTSVTTPGINNARDMSGNYITAQALYAFVLKETGGTMAPTTAMDTVSGQDETTLTVYQFTHYSTDTRTGNNMQQEIWYLSPMPDIGFDYMDITAAWSGAGTLAINLYALQLIYVDTANPIAHHTTSQGTSTAPSTTIVSDPTHVVVGGVQSPGATITTWDFAAQTALFYGGDAANPTIGCRGDGDVPCSASPNGASVVMSWTLDVSVPWFQDLVDSSWSAGAPAVPIDPTITEVIHDASHNPITDTAPGASVHPDVLVTGTNGAPTGTVTFQWFSANGACSGTAGDTSGPFVVSGEVDATTFSHTVPSGVPAISYKVSYSGDVNYNPGTACASVTVHTIPLYAGGNSGKWTPSDDYTNVNINGPSGGCGSGSLSVTMTSIGSGFTGSNRLLVFGGEFAYSISGVTIPSVAVNGEPMTLVTSTSFTNGGGFPATYVVYTYQGGQIINGASVTVGFSGSGSFCTSGNMIAGVLSGVNQAAPPIRSHTTAHHAGSQSGPTVATASSYDDTVYEFLANNRGISPPNNVAPSGGQTQHRTSDNIPDPGSNCAGVQPSTCTVVHDATHQGASPTYTSAWSNSDAAVTQWDLTVLSVTGAGVIGGGPSTGPPLPLPPITCPSGTGVSLTDTRPEANNTVVYFIEWGDGSTSTSTSHTFTHNYSASGVYTITVRAQDKSGRIDIFQGKVDLGDPACHILAVAQLIGPFLLALLIILAFVFVVRLIADRNKKQLNRGLNIALLIGIIVITVVLAVFIYFGWAPELPGHIKF